MTDSEVTQRKTGAKAPVNKDDFAPVDADLPDDYVSRVLSKEKPLPPIEWKNILSEIQWVSFIILTTTPLLAVYGIFTTSFSLKTFIWATVYYFFTGLGITAGYHRLWAHRAYNASRPLQYFLACMGSGAVEGSIHWWARGHRAHHRYTDTDLDPYGAHFGLLWSHIGWMIVKPRRKPGVADISDLRKNPVIKFQHKFYLPLILFWGFAFPTLVAGLGWGDWRGGFYFAAVARLVFVHHSTFCVNSLAHYLGEASFDNKMTPRDHFITALVTVGEGYHNFHHQFPMDFRNAIHWYQYDPTKWFISTMQMLGLASHLKTFPDNEVQKGRLAMQLQKAYELNEKIEWPKSSSHLPVISWDDFVEESKTRPLIVVHGFIHDISSFLDEHPGGRHLLTGKIGKDATTAFLGGVYDHSNAAHNLLSMMRVGVLDGGYQLAKDEIARAESEQRAANSGVSSKRPAGAPPSPVTSDDDEDSSPATPRDETAPLTTSTVAAAQQQLAQHIKGQEVSAEEAKKRINDKALSYVVPGEAYRIIKKAELKANAKVDGTKFGKLI
ncbi:putative stearoyl-CoA desaturase [Violaceomyces palustris]|uniref:Stearoyl-CoA desaturase n=1 Tax=Violaceomyces palustris TaxID=1673888 RepID=A0ACD0P751_9BASI|nr:putative stearoyl-CoA desaturase [Violaceomyces palustris]